MSTSDEPQKALPDMPADVASLLDAIRTPTPISQEALGRMEHRLALSVAVSAGATAAASKGLGTAALTKLALFFSRKIPLGISALTIGIGIGAGAHAVATRDAGQKTEGPLVIVTQSVRAESTLPSVPTAIVPTMDQRDLPPAMTATPTKPPEPRASAVDTAAPSVLAEERALVEMARSALARGDNAAALTATQNHERAFANGRLREEREFIAVKALSGLGRSSEADARGARFLTSYPRSMFAPAVRAAIHTSTPE